MLKYLSYTCTSYWNFIIFFICACSSVAFYSLYKFLRPKLSIKVNCWFCNKDSSVPYGNRNCWDCIYCDQYNGFNENGDYNKPIPAQYDELLNHNNRLGSVKKKFQADSNGLCETCNRNQLLKIKQLAAFVPHNMDSFDIEVEAFGKQLDLDYKLCHPCEAMLHQRLGLQDSSLREKVFSWKMEHKRNEILSQNKSVNSIPIYVRFLQMNSLGIIILVCINSVYALQNTTRTEVIPLRKIIPHYVLTNFIETRTWFASPEFSLLGFFLLLGAILSAGKDRLRIVDALNCFVWLTTLFIQLPFVLALFPSKEERLMIQGISAFLGMLLTTALCLRPGCTSRGKWRHDGWKSPSDVLSYSSSISCDQTSIYEENQHSPIGSYHRPLDNNSLQRLDTVQDNSISTTTLRKHSARSPGSDFALDNHLQAMKISTPKKCQNMSGIFTKRIYNSRSSLLCASNSSLNLQRCVLSPARLKAKSITQSSWVGGGYWAPSNPHYSRSLFGTQSGQFSRGFYQPISTCSCPTSRAGSVSGDDKLSVYSEPGHLRSPTAFSDVNYYRNSLSPVRDSPCDRSLNSSTASSGSSCSRISTKQSISRESPPLAQYSSNIRRHTGFQRPTWFQLFLGFSLITNVVLMTFVILPTLRFLFSV